MRTSGEVFGRPERFWGSKCWSLWECTWEVGGWTTGWKLLKHRSRVESLPHFFIWVKNSGPSGWSNKIHVLHCCFALFVGCVKSVPPKHGMISFWRFEHAHRISGPRWRSRLGKDQTLPWYGGNPFFRNHPKTSHFVWSPGLSGKPVLLAISCAKRLCFTAPEGISVTEVTFQSTIHTFKAYNLQLFLYMKT